MQLRLIADIVALAGSSNIDGIAFFDRERGWQSFDLSFLRSETEFNATRFLINTGKLKPSRFPPRTQIRQYLEPFNHQKKTRALKKALIYLQALFCPERLRQNTGLWSYRSDTPAGSRSTPLPPLRQSDVLAILGGSWEIPEIEELALRHHAAGGRVAVMVYDLIPHTHPDFQTEHVRKPFNAWLEKTPRYVTDYICISEHTARDMRSFLANHASTARVIAVPLAHEFPGYARDHEPRPGTLQQLRHKIPGPFVLCVGSIEVRKNGLALLQAWEKVCQVLGLQAPTLVFAGKIAWKSEAFVAHLHKTRYLQGKAFVFESPSDEELAALYNQCLFTAYPSLAEGWGLPVGESAWFGKFAVVSTASSIPEVCGPLVDYVDPQDIDDIAAKLLRPLQDAHYLATRTQAIGQARLRTWQEVAAQIHGILADGAGHG